jgi:hypothetical protein
VGTFLERERVPTTVLSFVGVFGDSLWCADLWPSHTLEKMDEEKWRAVR